jgi:RNA polymerase sigma factor (sigma-70 family)
MAITQTTNVLHYVRRLAVACPDEEVDDGRLLGRFADLGDEAAFAALVRRHASLVLGTCRRVLHNSHDAEDCFQATFLVLARRAGSLSALQTLGPWLHGVALRTALKARGRAQRRRQLEERAARLATVEQDDDMVWRDLRPVLDEAVSCLAEKYRTAFILCSMQGATVTEAARQVGCPSGTLAARLARAKERLRVLLVRRGVALGTAAVGAGLFESDVSARASELLVSSTVKAAGQSVVPGVAFSGTGTFVGLKGVVEVMVNHKFKVLLALVLGLTVVAGAATWPNDLVPPEQTAPASECQLGQEKEKGFNANGDAGEVPALPGAPGAADRAVSISDKVRFLSLAEALAIALNQPSKSKPMVTPGPLVVERDTNQMLLNTEVAYWNLYGSYWTLFTREQGMRMAYEVYSVARSYYEANRIRSGDIHQARGQYELFRAQRLQAAETVREAERQFRMVVGLPAEDGKRLVPSDAPTLTQLEPDWDVALREALQKRPELRLARQAVKTAQANLLTAGELPDSRNGALREAKLALARAVETARDQEQKARHFLGVYHERLATSNDQIKANRAQREAFAEQLLARDKECRAGRCTLDLLLEAQRFWADALSSEFGAIVTYNNTLSGFAFARGASKEHARVHFADGTLPEKDSAPAVARETRRTRLKVKREPAVTINSLVFEVPARGEGVKFAPTLAGLWKIAPPLVP